MGSDKRQGTPQWLLAMLPAFPLILLVLRLWLLSGQDLQAMLLLVQHVDPLGPISTLAITLMWSIPVVILIARTLGALLNVSTPDHTRSWLIQISMRIPDWVVVVAGLLAALVWQLRFLPALLMLLLMILGLEVRTRYGRRGRLVQSVCVGLPLAAAVAACIWLAPAITEAIHRGEMLTALTLLLPLCFMMLLTGPLPERSAKPVTHWTGLTGALLALPLISASFLRAPVLPTVAIEVREHGDKEPASVLIGQVADVDDTMTTMLDTRGRLHFVPNEHVRSKVLCPGNDPPPFSEVHVHGWQVEQSMLNWVAPHHPSLVTNPLCQGRIPPKVRALVTSHTATVPAISPDAGTVAAEN